MLPTRLNNSVVPPDVVIKEDLLLITTRLARLEKSLAELTTKVDLILTSLDLNPAS